MNPATIIIGLIVFAVFVAIIWRGIYNKKHNKSSCSSSGCSGCAHSEFCHPQPKPLEDTSPST